VLLLSGFETEFGAMEPFSDDGPPTRLSRSSRHRLTSSTCSGVLKSAGFWDFRHASGFHSKKASAPQSPACRIISW
jgi:hypothetical protein